MLTERLDIDSYINSRKQDIIEAFVLFYGEENRERITERANNTIFVGYVKPSDYRSLVSDIKQYCKKKAVNYFFDNIGITFNNEEEREKATYQYFGTGDELGYSNLEYFYKYYNSGKASDMNTALIYLQSITGNKDLTLDSKEFIEEANRINSYKTIYYGASSIYNDEIAKYRDYTDRLDVVKETITRVENEVNEIYIQEIYKLLSDEEKKIIDNSSYIDWNKIKGSFLFNNGYVSYKYTGPAEFFTKESDMELNDPNTSDYNKKRIMDERINYFKKMGIDLGDNYEDYINNEEVKKIYPSEELVDFIVNLKERLKLMAEEKIIKETPYNKGILERIMKDEYTMSSNEIINVINSNSTCITTNYKKENNGEITKQPIMFISGYNDIPTIDCRIIHEFNHVYELRLHSFENNTIVSATGWDYCADNLSTECELTHNKPIKRDYELLNEIINELIAQDICKLAHGAGIFLIGDETISKNSSETGYEEYRCLADYFYNTYKKEIISSRREGDMSIIFDKVGEENFTALNNLIKEFREYFNGFKYVRTIIDISENKETEDTKKYYEFLERRNDILQKMEEYSNTKTK